MQKNIFPVAIYNSFDSELPVIMCDTEKEATDLIKELFEEELKIQKENFKEELGSSVEIETDHNDEWTWAMIKIIEDEGCSEPIEDTTEYILGNAMTLAKYRKHSASVREI